MPSAPPAVRNPPAHACFVCRRKDGDSALLLCNGGCGILRHATCVPKRRGGPKRALNEEEDDDDDEEEEVMVLDAVAIEPEDEPISPPSASGATGHVTPSAGKVFASPGRAVCSIAEPEVEPTCWRCERCSAIVGMRVFARAESKTDSGAGFYWPGKVLSRDPHGQVRVQWEPRSDNGPFCDTSAATAASDETALWSSATVSSPSSSSSTSSSTISPAPYAEPEPAWISERHVALLATHATADELRRGKRALAVWVDGHGYSCEILGSAGRGSINVHFDDGLQYDVQLDRMRGLLDEPLFQVRNHRQKLGDDQWSTDRQKQWSTDSDVGGPLQRTLARLLRIWRGVHIEKVPGTVWQSEPGPIEGVLVVRDFLNSDEVRTFRLLFAAAHPWGMYHWGKVGQRAELASILSRIDFGLPDMTAEGVAAAKSNVQPIGELQLQVISLLEERLRRAFGKAAWGGEVVSPTLSPNMMQVRRASPEDLLRISSGSAVSPPHRSPPHRSSPHLHLLTFLTFVPPLTCVWVRSSRASLRPRVWATTTIGATSGRRASHRLRGATASASIVTRVVTNGNFRCSWGLQDQARRPWRRLCRRGARIFSSGTRRDGRRCAPSYVSHTRAASAAGPTESGMRRRSTTASRSRCASTTPNGAGTVQVAAAIIELAANHTPCCSDWPQERPRPWPA